MDNKIDYSVRKGIRPTPKCEDYELCACDADGASHTLKVSFNESDQIVDAVIERVNNNGQLEWRGPEDGFPPVGQRVQFKQQDDTGGGLDGLECTVISNGKDDTGIDVTTVQFELHGYQAFMSDCFRPILSEEDKAVEEMVNYRKAHHWSDEQFCRELYRAGYRKQEDK